MGRSAAALLATAAVAPAAAAGWGTWALSGSLGGGPRVALTAAVAFLALLATAAAAAWVALTRGELARDPFGEYLRTGRPPSDPPAGPVVQGLTAVGVVALLLLRGVAAIVPRRSGPLGVRTADVLDLTGALGAVALVVATGGTGLAVWTLGLPADAVARAAVTAVAVLWAALGCLAALLYFRDVRRRTPVVVLLFAASAPLWLLPVAAVLLLRPRRRIGRR